MLYEVITVDGFFKWSVSSFENGFGMAVVEFSLFKVLTSVGKTGAFPLGINGAMYGFIRFS